MSFARAGAMRSILTTLIALLLLAEVALAHGGRGYRGPGSSVPPGLREASDPAPPPPPPHPAVARVTLPCDCGGEACRHCKARPTPGVVRHTPARDVVARWGELQRVRLTYGFTRTEADATNFDGVERFGKGKPVAVVGLQRKDGTTRQKAVARPTQLAWRDYLVGRTAGVGEPALVATIKDGGYRVRACRLPKNKPVFLTIDTFEFVPDAKNTRVRGYVTRSPAGHARMMIVMPHRVAPEHMVPAYLDGRTGLAIYFLDPEASFRWIGLHVDAAEDVPCVHALESALTGRGGHAVTRARTLVVREAQFAAAPELKVGSTRRR